MHLSTLCVSGNQNWTFVCLVLFVKISFKKMNPWNGTLNPQPKVGLSQKWSWWLTGAIIYPSFSLQSLSHSSNGFSQRWSYKLDLIAYESGRKESFDCMRENQKSKRLQKRRFQGLTTEYRANFLGIFIGVARWLGGSVVPTNEPPSRRATKLYNLDWRATEPPSH